MFLRILSRWILAPQKYSILLFYSLLIFLTAQSTDAQASWTEVQACREIEGQLTLRCATNQRIMIFSANYGNSSGYNCSAHSAQYRRSASTPHLYHNSSTSTMTSLPKPLDSSTTPPIARCDHDMTSVVKDLCSGRDVCLIEIEEGTTFRTPCDGNESLNVRFACIPASQVIAVCNRNLTSSNGHILSPGYPEYYPGPAECSWRISTEVGKNILIMLNDLSLRPQSAKDNICQDYLVIYENDRQLVKTCHSYPFNLQVASNTARISLVSNSKGWSSKGVWLFYKAIGCSNPFLPELVHISKRNYTSAILKCQEGFFFHDVGHPFNELLVRCVDGLEWDRSVPNCINDSEWRKGALANLELSRRGANTPISMLNGATLQEIVIPSTVIGALLLVLIAVLGIVLTLRRHRRRGVVYHNHEIEHLHIVRKAPRAQIDSATDLVGSYPLTEIRD